LRALFLRTDFRNDEVSRGILFFLGGILII
jgi:hypothetical protein